MDTTKFGFVTTPLPTPRTQEAILEAMIFTPKLLSELAQQKLQDSSTFRGRIRDRGEN